MTDTLTLSGRLAQLAQWHEEEAERHKKNAVFCRNNRLHVSFYERENKFHTQAAADLRRIVLPALGEKA